MLRRAYQKLLELAAGPKAEPALAVVSFAEASFFPLPPDIMLGPMATARPEKWLRFALVCSVASLLGGLAGYAIGYFLFETVGQWLINLFHYGDKMDAMKAFYDEWGFWAIIGKGFTPIPFKLVTITSGVFRYPILPFILGVALTRTMRFVLVAWLFQKFGPTLAPVIEKRIGMVSAAVVVAIVVGIGAIYFLH